METSSTKSDVAVQAAAREVLRWLDPSTPANPGQRAEALARAEHEYTLACARRDAEET